MSWPFYRFVTSRRTKPFCAAPDQAAAMPVEGGFFGDGVISTLTAAIEIAADLA